MRVWIVALGLVVLGFGAAEARPGSLHVRESATSANQRADRILADLFEARLRADPMFASQIGDKRFQGAWEDPSAAAERAERVRTQRAFAAFSRLPYAALNPQHKLSYAVLQNQAKAAERHRPYENYAYRFNQMFGVQSGLPTSLMNVHSVTSRADAEAYIARLNGLGPVLDTHVARMNAAAQAGVVAPRFTFDLVISDSRNLIAGAPFGPGPDSPLWADVQKKFDALSLPAAEKDALKDQARTALITVVAPAYQRAIAALTATKALAKGDLGVWALPQGDAYYAERLRYHTTTDLTPDQIHALGLAEVARIHGEIHAIMKRVDFKGSLQDFLIFTRSDARFFLPGTPEGRAQYLKTATALVDDMRARIPTQFGRLPKAAMEVRAVEAFREQSAGLAFYERSSPDGSRPGYYYINLYDMREAPIYEMEALAFHEGIPGHHMQVAIAQENPDIPAFRRHSWVTAYGEGWALYTEELAKEMGFYQDPYADYGRLTMELWRAARLVVDTGIHAKRWSKEQAVQYLVDNTPTDRAASERAINRYLVMPGQATSYLIGKLKIMELRQRAKTALGTNYDQRGFHDLILANGPLPLSVLERQMDGWIAAHKR